MFEHLIKSEEDTRMLIEFIKDDIFKVRNPELYKILQDRRTFLRKFLFYKNHTNYIKAISNMRVNTHNIFPLQGYPVVNVDISGTVIFDKRGFVETIKFADPYNQLIRGYVGRDSGQSNQPLACIISNVLDFLKEQGQIKLNPSALGYSEKQFISNLLNDPANSYLGGKGRTTPRINLARHFTYEFINTFLLVP